MAGIGNTVETDLVGELVAVYEQDGGYARKIGAGRVRAVTSASALLVLWIENLDNTMTWPYMHPVPDAGDIVTVFLDPNDGRSGKFIRIKKER